MIPRCAWCDVEIDREQSLSDLCADCNAVELKQIEQDERARWEREWATEMAIDAARGK